MELFYVYGYKRENESVNGESGSYYYIGKGTGDRAWSKRKGEIKPPKNKENIEIICKDMSEDDAFQLEISLIAKYGRIDLGTGSLHNRTDGGEGVSGFVHSDEAKAKISVAQKGLQAGSNNPMFGKTHSDETKAKMSAAMSGAKNPNYGKAHSDEAKAKISVAQKGLRAGSNNPMFGKTHSDVAKAKMSAAKSGANHPMYGKTLSDETKAKMSAAHKGANNPNFGKTLSDETKAKLSVAQKGLQAGSNNPMFGKTHSDETKAKMSAAHKGVKHTPKQNAAKSARMKGKKNGAGKKQESNTFSLF